MLSPFFTNQKIESNDDVTYICDRCYNECCDYNLEQDQKEPCTLDEFLSRGFTEEDFYSYLVVCYNIMSITQAYGLSSEKNEDTAYFEKLIRKFLILAAKYNMVADENAELCADRYPIKIISNVLFFGSRVRLRIGDKLLNPFDDYMPESYGCTETPTNFRLRLEKMIENYNRTGYWLNFKMPEWNPVHRITLDDYEKIDKALWKRCYNVHAIKKFGSYEELSSFITEEYKKPHDNELYEQFESGLSDFYWSARTRKELQEKINKQQEVLYICKQNIRCITNKHRIISAKLNVHTLNGVNSLINASYCTECKLLFIQSNLYESFREQYGLPLIKMVSYDEFISHDNDAKVKSILAYAGYSVSRQSNLSEERRHSILAGLIASGALSKYDILNYLEWFINYNGRKPENYEAVEKWRQDLRFVASSEIDEQVEMIAQRIVLYRDRQK